MAYQTNMIKKTIGALLLNIITIFSITAYAQQPNRIEFDIANKNLPTHFDAIVAFIYEDSDGIAPGVVRRKEINGHFQWPFSIKTQSNFISVTHAEIIFDGHAHKKYQVDPSCSTMRVLDGRGVQLIYLNINLEKNVLSCSATDN